jgi:hypothetical protein
MQIILIHPRLKQARTIAITLPRVAAVATLAGVLATGVWSVLGHLGVGVSVSVGSPPPIVASAVAALAPAVPALPGDDEPRLDDRFMRENLDALAMRIGKLQAQIARLDAIGERVASMAGVGTQDLPRASLGRGGALPSIQPDASIPQMHTLIESMSRGIDHRIDDLNLIESDLLSRTVRSKLLPSSQPLEIGAYGSGFGWRIDPFTGTRAMHEGIDFAAPVGTPILAAAAGVVVVAGWDPAYGRQVDIDHGQGLVTRYAHASKLHVKRGDIVKQGQKIAEVGSSGRSTGPHLHFEVRIDNVAQDPRRYLQSGLNLASSEEARRSRRR